MRFISLIPAVVALFVSGAASAQTWAEYVNREDFFTVNMPGDPTVETITYKTPKGTSLPAHVYRTPRPAPDAIAPHPAEKAPEAQNFFVAVAVPDLDG